MKKRIVLMLFTLCAMLLVWPQNAVAVEGSTIEMGEPVEAEADVVEAYVLEADVTEAEVITAVGYKHSGSQSMSKLSKAQIKQLLEDNSLTLPGEMFEVLPSYSAPYGTGKVKDEAIQVAVDRLNALRRIAGLPAVVADSALNANAQYGAVLLAAPGVDFGHYPTQPADMDDAFYEQALSATSSSNIYGGVSLSYSVDGFMDDSDAGNVSRLGHRRWQLNPAMGKIGFGYAENPNARYRRYVTEKVFDRSGAGCEYDFIGWPASGNFPSSQFEEHVAWSVTLNPAKYQTPVASEIAVVLSRAADGKVWTFNGNNTYTASGSGEYFNVNTGGYGVSNCIIFRPDGITTYDGIYTVQIIGLKDKNGNAVDFAYQVDFFDESKIQSTVLTEDMFVVDTTPEMYDGTEKRKAVTSGVLIENVDYVVSYENNVNAGTAVIYITGIGNCAGEIRKTFTIEKATRNFGAYATSTSLYTNTDMANILISFDNASAEVSHYYYNSNNYSVAYADSNGCINTGKKEGTAVITVEARETANYGYGSMTVEVSVRNLNIDIADVAGGSIVSDAESAYVGQRVTLEPLPEAGYRLQSVNITDTNGNPVDVYPEGDGKFYFYVPASDVRIVAVFEPANEQVKIELSYIYVNEAGENATCLDIQYVPEGTTWGEFFAGYQKCFNNGVIADANQNIDAWEIWVQNVLYDNVEACYDSSITDFNQYTDCALVSFVGLPENYKHGYVAFEYFEGEQIMDSGTGWDILLPTEYSYGSDEAITYVKRNLKIHSYIYNYCNKTGATVTVTAPWEPTSEGQWEGYCVTINAPGKEERLRAFVERMYTVALGRDAEESGVNYWVDLLRSGKNDGEDIAKGFFTGEEFVGRNLSNSEYLEILYTTFFDRAGDEEGWTYNMGLLENNIGRDAVLDIFITSSEFAAICESYGITAVDTQEKQVTRFVERMYTVALDREAEAEGVTHWVGLLLGGDTDAEDVAKGFFNGEEFIGRNLSNSEYLEVLYATFFDRTGDEEGWTYNMGLLESGVSREEVLAVFIDSTEFEALCSGYGIKAVYTRDEQVRSFVDRMYTKALGRESEESGASYWTNTLLDGKVTGAEVADSFINSVEFENRGLSDKDYITTLYETFFGRTPVEDDMAYWGNTLAANGRRPVFIGFVNSQEFAILCEKYEIIAGTIE